MKRLSVKQVILYVGGILMCQMSWMGCFPLIPAFFTAVCLEDAARGALFAAIFTGIVLFVPIAAAVKYLMAVAVILVTIKLFEWAEGRCTVICAAASASIATFTMSLSGELLNVRDSAGLAVCALEAVFVFSSIMIGTRFVDFFMQISIMPQKEESDYYQETKLGNYADSFSGLSKIFSRMSSAQRGLSTEQMGKIQNELTGTLCMNCNQCALCWDKEESPMYSYLAYMLQSLQRTGEADEEIVVQMQEYCPYTEAVVQESIRIFEKARLNLAWYNRLLENREIIAQQLDAMAYIMEDCANEKSEITQENRHLLAEVKYRSRERGVIVQKPHLYENKDGHWQFICDAYAKNGSCISMKELAKAVSAGLERGMRPHRDERAMVSPQGAVVVFEEDTCFHETHAVARMVKDGGHVSGDNYSFLEMDNGQIAMMLSDGMGSGSNACKESELVLELLEKFLEAGFSEETALKMMNSAMVIRGEDDLYSTVDICSLDLYTGCCDLYKIGAATTFIKRRDYVERIESSSLPVGATHRIETGKTKKQLEDGDILVMMTDGVLEYLKAEDPDLVMCGILKNLQMRHPGQIADAVLEEVLERTGGKAADDMTILVCSVWKK
ncbi:Stage II sporulation protein E [Eubacterium plexicaudatum ASF492]|uniref:Stage II sporulation protein E n=1 Tax=Eubacterium plexicaudatum ASF492 TaxID=1235802 RepID=N2A2J1_9FIRM|nr:Stage II sporulation protein E [Eubacterium plexicaudatum ASF492]